MSKQPPMAVAVIGVGRMGRHHARTYAQMDEANLLAVVDQNEERAETIADEYGCKAYTCTQTMLAAHPQVRAVTVAVPTACHEREAGPLMDQHIACLIEKPLAPTVEQAQRLARQAEQCSAVLQVGHTERFNPAVRAVAQMKLPARYIEVNRVSPMTFRSLDVGVVMDMMIHDLDIVLMLAGSPIKKVDATGVAVMGEHEDIASARIVFENGCVATLTASRLALKTQRKLRLFSEAAYVSLDYQHKTGTVIRRTANNDKILAQLRDGLAKGQDLSDLDWSELVAIEELAMNLPDGEQDPLTAELRSFLKAVTADHPPVVDAEAGYFAVSAAEQVVQAIRGHKWVGLEKL